MAPLHSIVAGLPSIVDTLTLSTLSHGPGAKSAAKIGSLSLNGHGRHIVRRSFRISEQDEEKYDIIAAVVFGVLLLLIAVVGALYCIKSSRQIRRRSTRPVVQISMRSWPSPFRFAQSAPPPAAQAATSQVQRMVVPGGRQQSSWSGLSGGQTAGQTPIVPPAYHPSGYYAKGNSVRSLSQTSTLPVYESCMECGQAWWNGQACSVHVAARNGEGSHDTKEHRT